MFETIYGGGLALAFGMRLWYRWTTRQRVVTRTDVTWREYVVLGQGFVGILVIPLLHLTTPIFGSATYHLPPWAGWLGTGLFGTALWVLWRSHADLGRNWSQTLHVRQGHDLVTHGVYTHIRHPMYAAFMLWGIAQPLLLQNWIAGWSHLLAFLVVYVVRVPREEAMLQAHFGATYTAYMQRTGRILPRWREDSGT